MIRFLDPRRFYTNRQYLTQWFQGETLCVTDNDLEDTTIDRTRELLAEHPNPRRILDITHNPWPDNQLPVDIYPRLTNNFEFFYRPSSGVFFFPLFLWAYSLRKTLWWEDFVFDAGINKTQGFMCLNNQPREHRTKLYQLMQNNGAVSHIVYTINRQGLPDEPTDLNRNDVGVGHPVYAQTAVNIVTETAVDLAWISEKTCKPFVAHQIPIIVASAGVNKFLQDTGLDMFEDLVPWQSWDSESDTNVRLEKIAAFVEQWIHSGTILDDYRRVLPRIQANKQYFHSEAFRNRIMNQMPRTFGLITKESWLAFERDFKKNLNVD